jgi:hypothetical protein
MQKFNALKSSISRIEQITSEIRLLLLKGESIDFEDTLTINLLYTERKSLLNELQQFMYSDEGKEICLKNSTFFKEFFEKIMENDKNNLNLLKDKIVNISEKLKVINKNKSLMIYQK